MECRLRSTPTTRAFDTDRNRGRKLADPEGWADHIKNFIWKSRAAHPDEMVGAAIFLSSEACSFMTDETDFVTYGY